MPDGSRQIAPQQRAYSLLTIKTVDNEQRIITGIASTPEVDRMGDIVEPKGAVFKLPLPLLYQHNSQQPIGQVTAAKVTDTGIEITARIAKGVPVAFIDEAWELVKAGLVPGFSIGFSPIEYSFMKDGGIHFTKCEIYEISCVTVPANASATIDTIKSIDQSQRAASGAVPRGVVRLSSPPGASGTTPLIPKETKMHTPVAEQISAYANRRAAAVGRMDEIMNLSTAAGATLDEAQAQEYDNLSVEVKTVDGHIKRLRDHEAVMLQSPVVVDTKGAQPTAQVRVDYPRITDVRLPKLEKGVKFARWAGALAITKGNLNEALAYIQNRRDWCEQSPEVLKMAQLANRIGTADFTGYFVNKTAVPAGDSTTSGWASEWAYAQNVESEFVEYLRPLTVMGRVDALVPFRRVPFNFRTGTMTGGTTAYWAGQGAPVPMSKPTSSSGTLGITKLVGMTAVDDELLRLGSPAVDVMLRDDLASAIVLLGDTSFLDPTQGGVANTQPAAITYGATATQASGTDFAALKTDIKATFAGMITANQGIAGGVWIMSETAALALSLMVTSLGVKQNPDMTPTGGMLLGLPVVTSQSAYIGSGSPDYGNMIVLVYPREIWLADDGQASIETSREATIQMLDNPTNTSTGGTTATTGISMFQTNSTAIKALRFINWKARGTRTACAFIRNALYV